jgi:hypothetical protein
MAFLHHCIYSCYLEHDPLTLQGILKLNESGHNLEKMINHSNQQNGAMHSQTKVLGIMLLAAVVAAAGGAAIFSAMGAAEATDRGRISGTLTAPSNGNPFGGDQVGTFSVLSDGSQTSIFARVDIVASEGSVLEGWLVDEGTGYKLSLGQLNDNNGSLIFHQDLVNAYTYNVLVITEEPDNDTDPNPATPVGGAPLPSPFGQ